MNNSHKLNELVKQAADLHSLLRGLISCIDGIENSECKDLMKEINVKIKQFKKTDKELIDVSARSIRSERLAAMGRMAAAISHELRNPLSGIKVAVEYLARKLKDQAEVGDIINNIHSEVIFANNIISNILEYVKISSPNLKKSNIKSLIEEAILTVAQQGFFNNIKIKKQVANDLPALDLDPLQIRQILMNLFINSAEAMIGGGILSINVSQQTDMVVIRVADNGVGIEKEQMKKLFEPFFTTKVKGIGLGLAIAEEIVVNHDGKIDVVSKVGKGTTFTIRLPLKREDF